MTRRGPIRWGVVGTGWISAQVISDLKLVDGAIVSAVTSREPTRAKAFADRFEVEHHFSDYDAMLASDIDAVYVATPHVTHFKFVAAAIRHGRHVLCEKPIGLNAAEVRELASLAANAGVFLMEAMWMKFNPLYVRMRELIAAGSIGEVRNAQANFGGPFPQDESSRWQRGGSVLLDQGIYLVTLAHMLFGPPDEIRARGTVRTDGVDLRQHFTFDYSDDRFFVGASSMVDAIDPTASVGGSEAWMTVGEGFWRADRLTIHRLRTDGPPDHEVITTGREGNGYVPMLRAVVASLRDGLKEHPLHTAADTATVYDAMDEIRRQISLR